MPGNRSSLAAYARTQYVLTYSPSTPSRIPENCLFSGMLPQPAGWDTCMHHAMHYQYHIGRYANAQACTEAHQDSAARCEWPPCSRHEDEACLLFPSLHDQEKAPAGTTTTSRVNSTSAILGGGPADSVSIRTSGAGVEGPMAARDTESKCSVSLFI